MEILLKYKQDNLNIAVNKLYLNNFYFDLHYIINATFKRINYYKMI
jgi:hypothetical protein